ncbi:hypothetical protein IEQ34_009853 [Dendrobium chrysotoxum]|uniref:Uncharacterized protein n=1 Tax=Dendrobium chrysotoxum TaxID=161865 RepID=A0AAV7H429_DENCH|nr:hypothetical protein IEQ34_009853 [Dendrobium chrysotoxum]
MSLVFSPMKVVTGPMRNIKEHQVGLPIFIHGEKKEKLDMAKQVSKAEELRVVDRRGINGYSLLAKEEEEEEEAEASSQSSSIGVLSSSSSNEEEDLGDEAQSKLKDEGRLGSLTSLEESLPIKRGLSNFFSGKSKSFASLAEATSCNATDIVKQENPFNKRRRILMSCKASWRRRASCTSLITSFSPLLHPELVKEDEEEDEDDEEEHERETGFPMTPPPSLRKSFKNPKSHSFSNLQKL